MSVLDSFDWYAINTLSNRYGVILPHVPDIERSSPIFNQQMVLWAMEVESILGCRVRP